MKTFILVELAAHSLRNNKPELAIAMIEQLLHSIPQPLEYRVLEKLYDDLIEHSDWPFDGVEHIAYKEIVKLVKTKLDKLQMEI